MVQETTKGPLTKVDVFTGAKDEFVPSLISYQGGHGYERFVAVISAFADDVKVLLQLAENMADVALQVRMPLLEFARDSVRQGGCYYGTMDSLGDQRALVRGYVFCCMLSWWI